MHDERLPDDVPGGHARVQGAIRVLKYHLHLAAYASQLPPWHAAQVLAIEQDGASGGPVQLQYAPPRRGLPAPTLPYQPQRLSSPHEEADVIDCLDVPNGALDEEARGNRKVHLQVLHLYEHIVSRLMLGKLQRFHAPCSLALDTRGSATKQAEKWPALTAHRGGISSAHLSMAN